MDKTKDDVSEINSPSNNPEIDSQDKSQFASHSKSKRGGITGMHNPMLHQNLSRVMRWYTGRVTFEAHKVEPLFNWQRRFHDHIIRNKNEFNSIARYILKNPLNWENDLFYKPVNC